MPLYQVIGLRTFNRKSTTYQVDHAGRIQKDAQGKPLVEPCDFTHYVLYVQDRCDRTFYAIELFDSVGASFEKHAQLCRYGHMHVSLIAKKDIQITYQPLRDLVFEYTLSEGMYDFEDDIDVYEYEESLRIFAFSACAGDDRIPDGYVLVNMDNFYENPSQVRCYLSWNICV